MRRAGAKTAAAAKGPRRQSGKGKGAEAQSGQKDAREGEGVAGAERAVDQGDADVHMADSELGDFLRSFDFTFEETFGVGQRHLTPEQHGGAGETNRVRLERYPSWDTADDYDIMHRYGLGFPAEPSRRSVPKEPRRAKLIAP